MEKFYELQPEVAGSWGENTLVDRSTKPFKILRIDYCFEDWFGSDLITSNGSFLVSQKIGNLLKITEKEELKGFILADCMLSFSETFHDLHPQGLQIPAFFWLKISGKPYESDFWINEKKRLVVSEKALEILKKGNLEHCLITEV